MPHLHFSGWGRLKPNSDGLAPTVPIVPGVFDSIVTASVFRDSMCCIPTRSSVIHLLFNWSVRGYRVIPQGKVGNYRLDMVVEGHNDARLAIECDGVINSIHCEQRKIKSIIISEDCIE